MKTKTIFSITAGLMLIAGTGFGQILPLNTNTTYGGVAQDGSTYGFYTTTPGGSFNSGFGTNVFGLTSGGTPAVGGNNNSALGYESMYSIKTGSSNTAAGYQSLYTNSTGSNNIANGYQALYSNTIGTDNSATGYTALFSNTTGNYNTANGWRALTSNTTALWNTAIGADALATNIKGTGNSAVGGAALFDNTGSYNTAVGYEASYHNTSADTNYAGGVNALFDNKIGNANVAQGMEALFTTTAGENTAIGTLASFSNTTGTLTTGTGYKALYNNITSFTTGFGAEALYSNKTGKGNSALGYQASYENATGNQNSALGYQALFTNQQGTDNTGMGFLAMFNNISNSITGVGSQVLFNNIGGKQNAALGYQASYGNTNGSQNSALGYQAMFSNVTGSVNSALGNQAMFSNVTGNENLAVGGNALFSNVAGTGNTAVGCIAGAAISGDNNTAVGMSADVIAGINDATAIGANAQAVSSSNMILGDNTINVGIGMSGFIPTNRLEISNYSAATGAAPCGNAPFSTFTAPLCPSAAPTGASGLQFRDLTNASVPWANNPTSGFLTVDDSGNVVLMAGSGGSGGTGIGYCSTTGLTPLTDDGGYNLNFRNFYFAGNSSQFLSQNDVSIGNGCGYVPKAKLDVYQFSGWSQGNSVGIFVENDDFGGCLASGNNNPIVGMASYLPAQTFPTQTSVKVAGWFESDSTLNCCNTYTQYAILVPQYGGNVEIGVPATYTSVPCANSYLLDVYGTGVFATSYITSDSNLKTNIAPLKKQGTDALSVIQKLNGVSYNFKKSAVTDLGTSGTHYGFIAQQVAQVLPSVVKTDAHGKEAVAYNEITPWLVEGMKQQQQIIDSLKNALRSMQTCLNSICGQSSNPAGSNGNNSNSQDVTLSASADSPLLYQNAPNPFSSGTKINYYLPEGTIGATIVFYDSYGNQMKTIQLSQTGNGTLNITSDNLTSGIYSYSLILNEKVIDTKRMVLQK